MLPKFPVRLIYVNVFGCVLALAAVTNAGHNELQQARDKQDFAALDRLIQSARAAADKSPQDAAAHYELALANSYGAEISQEVHDKNKAKGYAEAGLSAAEKAVSLNGASSENHRILGTLCGQMISSNGLAAIKYGKCALEEVNAAIKIDPKSAENYVSHGVGNYYLPQALGGGVELAIQDFKKAAELSPNSSEAYLWLGMALRKSNQNAAAHKALAKAVELNPGRIWAKQQLEKTPAQ